MKNKILLLNLFLILFSNSNFAYAYDGGILSAGGDYTCAIDYDYEDLKCWGGGEFGSNKIPPLENPTSVSVGLGHTCVIDEEIVKCWGQNVYGQSNVPPLKHPTFISAGGYHTCAIDEEGVKCWGSNRPGRTKVPPLRNPTFVSVGGDHACAIDEDGVKCWGSNDQGQTKVPILKNPTTVSAGSSHACAVDDEGVKCWGANAVNQTQVPHLKNPTSVSSGRGYTCAIDKEGVKCWGSLGHGQTKVPPLRNPTSVSVGDEHACAIDEEGVKCWGSNNDGEINVPPLTADLFLLGKLEIIIDYLTYWSSPVRTIFFSSIKSFVSDNLKSNKTSPVSDQVLQGQYILMAFFSASIETGDSAYYNKKIIPIYLSRMKTINEQTGIHGLDQVKDFPLTRLTALKFMQVSLSIMTEFLTADDKAHIQDVIKLIGLAMTDVLSKQNINNALITIDTNETIIGKLSHSSKTQFLVLTLKTAQQWLKAKVQ